ncbi:hypothetical protein BDV98DRAFT_576300 [Pterulicium gracile]|uniref:MARVEL domain-containing protein n=1 Tax=Pterulicium gracile TaxID=1884261 RepID=A0A5C3Q2X0_9AGAR|nr:hypothetical protein BDV98DRAFT_576300 [Pterula gracilis]
MALSNKLPLIRLVVFGICIFFSLIVLALAGNAIDTMKNWGMTYRDSTAFGVAMGVLTMASLGPALVLGLLKRDAVTSKIIVELPVIGVLWVLWLACAALFGDDNNSFFRGGCAYGGGSRAADDSEKVCRQFGALTAFSFLTWILLTVYGVALLVLTIMATKRTGNNAPWHASVHELSSETFDSSSETPGTTNMNTLNTTPATVQQPSSAQPSWQPTSNAPPATGQYSSYPQV